MPILWIETGLLSATAYVFNMTSHALLFTIAAIGVSETAYLIKTRVRFEKPVCPIGGGCITVLTSKYSRLFFVPNDVWGLLFYIVSSLIAAFLVIGVEPMAFWYMILKTAIASGALFSVFLTYLQWRVIKAWCFWCLMSACTVWLMGAILGVSNLLAL